MSDRKVKKPPLKKSPLKKSPLKKSPQKKKALSTSSSSSSVSDQGERKLQIEKKFCHYRGCNQKQNPDTASHWFPVDKKLCRSWAIRSGNGHLANEDPSILNSQCNLCDKHFAEEMYQKNRKAKKPVLKPTAVPEPVSDYDEADDDTGNEASAESGPPATPVDTDSGRYKPTMDPPQLPTSTKSMEIPLRPKLSESESHPILKQMLAKRAKSDADIAAETLAKIPRSGESTGQGEESKSFATGRPDSIPRSTEHTSLSDADDATGLDAPPLPFDDAGDSSALSRQTSIPTDSEFSEKEMEGSIQNLSVAEPAQEAPAHALEDPTGEVRPYLIADSESTSSSPPSGDSNVLLLPPVLPKRFPKRDSSESS